MEDALHHPWIISLAQSSQNVPLPVTLMANLKVSRYIGLSDFCEVHRRSFPFAFAVSSLLEPGLRSFLQGPRLRKCGYRIQLPGFFSRSATGASLLLSMSAGIPSSKPP